LLENADFEKNNHAVVVHSLAGLFHLLKTNLGTLCGSYKFNQCLVVEDQKAAFTG